MKILDHDFSNVVGPLLVILILLAACLWVWFLGWLIVVIIGWFGPHLAVWQGMIIALVVSVVFGRGSR